MHTFDGDSCIIVHHSDLSGDMHIKSKLGGGAAMQIKGEDLLHFIADYVRMKKISALEQASAEEILGIEE